MRFGNRLARENINLNGPDELLFVRGRDFLGRFWIEPLQETMQMAGRMLASGCAEPLAQFFRTLRHVGQALEQRAQIQSSANGEYRQTLAPPQFSPNFQRQLAVP